ncbi:DUF1992 domain-containing protein [Bacillus sp. FJAT-49736]|uniref:DnaJ family domain-containing protein n=1 Tax=Bacillus sp. FJAT-49736 TaxID=2833582 RepID=UPI001BC8F54F|nr:DUF1992 domain-containing protein [Bacillus sp. FJAT-49736]MBS4175033.1 DUF1992 domain-containing protein [Bacillus sp. FJAT-49736]
MDFFRITEHRIKEGYKNGDFDNLPGMGKPLPEDEFANLPEDLRMAYRIMKNAGFTQEETSLKKEMMSIQDLIRQCGDNEQQEELTKELNEKLLKYNSVLSKRGVKTNSSIFKNYERKIENKLL